MYIELLEHIAKIALKDPKVETFVMNRVALLNKITDSWYTPHT